MLFSYKKSRYSTVKEEDSNMENTFKVIETQEDLDKIIQKRLAQKDREAAEQYKDFLSPEKAKELRDEYEKRISDIKKTLDDANAKLADHDKVVSDLTQRAQTAETTLLKSRIAHESGLPFELANRLVGSNEEELKKDAETLTAIIKPANTAPLHTGEHKSGSAPEKTTQNAAMLGLLSQINEQMQNN